MNPFTANIGIVFEGGEACGKATQSQLLAQRLGARVFSFPNYQTETGKAILGLLKGEWSPRVVGLHPGSTNDVEYAMLVRQSLFAANCYEVADDVAASMLNGPAVFDRYDLSSIVYGTVEGLNEEWLWKVHSHLPRPRVYVLLDASVEESFVRRPDRRDSNERDVAKLNKVRAEYLRVFQEKGPARDLRDGGDNPVEFVIVDGVGSIGEVHNRIWDAICHVLSANN